MLPPGGVAVVGVVVVVVGGLRLRLVLESCSVDVEEVQHWQQKDKRHFDCCL